MKHQRLQRKVQVLYRKHLKVAPCLQLVAPSSSTRFLRLSNEAFYWNSRDTEKMHRRHGRRALFRRRWPDGARSIRLHIGLRERWSLPSTTYLRKDEQQPEDSRALLVCASCHKRRCWRELARALAAASRCKAHRRRGRSRPSLFHSAAASASNSCSR